MHVTTLNLKSQQLLARWRAGRVDVHADGSWKIERRWWGKNASLAEVWLLGGWMHRQRDGDLCQAYWHRHPLYPQFLCLGYVVSRKFTTFRTLYRAQALVTEIARLHRAHALLCDVVNNRISDRLLDRWGWQRHCLESRRRLFIKRFYGEYPATQSWMAPA